MQIGMNMLLWTTQVTEEHHGLIEDLKAAGFDGIEIPLADTTDAEDAALTAHLDGLGLRRTAVAAVDEDHNPVSPDAGIRQAAVDKLKWALDKTAALGAESLVGPYHSAYKVFTEAQPTDDEMNWSAEVLREAGEHAATLNVTMAVEFLNRFECYLVNTTEATRDLLARVNHPSVGMLYDTHHANIEEKDVGEAIRSSASSICHIHISENDRGTPGRGQVNWDDTFTALKDISYDGWCVIEAFSTHVPGFSEMIHIWRDFSPPEEIYSEGRRFIHDRWGS